MINYRWVSGDVLEHQFWGCGVVNIGQASSRGGSGIHNTWLLSLDCPARKGASSHTFHLRNHNCRVKANWAAQLSIFQGGQMGPGNIPSQKWISHKKYKTQHLNHIITDLSRLWPNPCSWRTHWSWRSWSGSTSSTEVETCPPFCRWPASQLKLTGSRVQVGVKKRHMKLKKERLFNGTSLVVARGPLRQMALAKSSS